MKCLREETLSPVFCVPAEEEGDEQTIFRGLIYELSLLFRRPSGTQRVT